MKRHPDNIVNIPRKSKLNNIRNDVAIKNQVNRRFLDEQNAQQVPKLIMLRATSINISVRTLDA